MTAISLRRWLDYYRDWISPHPPGPVDVPLLREELRIVGELNDENQELVEFPVATSRDSEGSVLFINPGFEHPFLKARNDQLDRKWLRLWTKITVQAGYLSPQIDPSIFAILSKIRLKGERVEFIVDTNVLTSGVGRWLVRWFGDSADFVRTVVTDLEMQAWADDKNIWKPGGFAHLESRTNYLSACRFRESLGDGHPIWRRLDIEEESALIGPHRHGSAADVLLLRAARRHILDDVPRLRRFFVTSDWKLARSAAHDLPSSSVLAAYVNPLPKEGVYCGGVHWWPIEKSEYGGGFVSRITDFVIACLGICDSVRIVRSSGAWLRVRAYLSDENQYPSTWMQPRLWIETSPPPDPPAPLEISKPAESEVAAPANSANVRLAGFKEVQLERARSESGEKLEEIGVAGPREDPSDETLSKATPTKPELSRGRVDEAGSSGTPTNTSVQQAATGHELESWPLRPRIRVATHPCAARVSIPYLFELVTFVMRAVRDNRPIPARAWAASASTARETKTFLRAAGLLDRQSMPGPDAVYLPQIFATNDLDSLSALFARAENYNSVLEAIFYGSPIEVSAMGARARSETSLFNLARALGQAVMVQGRVWAGNGSIDAAAYVEWFIEAMTRIAARSPLGDAPIAGIAEIALKQLHISPVRFSVAMRFALSHKLLRGITFSAGGTPENILTEEIVILSEEGFRREPFAADNILGFRSVRRT